DISAGSERVVSDGSAIMPSAKIEGVPGITSFPHDLPLKKNSRKKKLSKTSVASTETDDTINHTLSNDNISRMGSELEKVLKEIDNIGNSIP
ncbi:2817_t:CDS:1, partial [Funneliformis mosseae]